MRASWRRPALIGVAASLVLAAVLLVRASRDPDAASSPGGGGTPSASGSQPPHFPAVSRPGAGATFVSALADCVHGHHCPEGTICGRAADGSIGCFRSNCAADRPDSCPEGHNCLLVSLRPQVFRCTPAGTVPAGALCEEQVPAARHRSCAAGLTCWHGRCRARCDARGASCPGGERCLAVSPGERVCAADACAMDSDCPESRPACVDLADSSPSSCFAVTDGSCRPGGCPAGQLCDGMIRDGRLQAVCRRACDTAADCGADHLCLTPKGAVGELAAAGGRLCYRACSFSAPQVCRAGEVCSTVRGDQSRIACLPAPGHMAATDPLPGWTDAVARPR